MCRRLQGVDANAAIHKRVTQIGPMKALGVPAQSGASANCRADWARFRRLPVRQTPIRTSKATLESAARKAGLGTTLVDRIEDYPRPRLGSAGGHRRVTSFEQIDALSM